MSAVTVVKAVDVPGQRAARCRRLADAILTLTPPPTRLRLGQGAVLQVDSGDAWLYVLLHGRVRLGRLSPTGRRVELGELSAPACLLTASAAEEMVEALERCELLPLRRNALRGLARSDPSLVDLLMTMLEDLLLDRERRLDLLAYPAVADRVAMALLRM
ncbi:MAG: Crp/Fnr family transcriptional regulator, partial [Candidatus Dormibacteraeota bacterium]|nr:Crp/Fnr family transcriptional regulator [Candidatus Dormibacteraeota bacterium]